MLPVRTATSSLCNASRQPLPPPFRAPFAGLRAISTTHPRRHPTSFSDFSGPAPPRLPKQEQEIFEELQRQSTGAFSTPRTSPKINQSPQASADEVSQADLETQTRVERMAEPKGEKAFKDEFERVIEARGKGEELHPDLRRGAKPEFEGDVNPNTGEVGGPKNEPLRWGAAGEWTYNGRATDF